MNKYEEGILDSIVRYYDSGATSTEKLAPLHGGLGHEIRAALEDVLLFPEKASIIAQGFDGGASEHRIATFTGTKSVDVTVMYDNKPVIIIQVKFPMSNHAQNHYNYLENMMGEVCNMRGGGTNVVIVNAIILAWQMPYFKKGKIFKKVERVNQKKILELEKLMSGSFPGAPDHLLLQMISRSDLDYIRTYATQYGSGETKWDQFTDSRGHTFPSSREEHIDAQPELSTAPDGMFEFLEHQSDLKNRLNDIVLDACERFEIPRKGAITME